MCRLRTIYLTGATFNLLPDDEAARAALGRIAMHLRPGGSALIPLFVPQSPVDADIGVIREHVTDDGDLMRVTVVDIVRDEAARDQVTELRYELVRGDDHQIVDRPGDCTGSSRTSSPPWPPTPASPHARSARRTGARRPATTPPSPSSSDPTGPDDRRWSSAR